MIKISLEKETIFSLVVTVGKPFQVDMATNNNKTRPCHVRVKVKVDLLGEFSKRVNVESRKRQGKLWLNRLPSNITISLNIGETINYIMYNEKKCFVSHPKLYPKKEGVRKMRKIRVKITTKRSIQDMTENINKIRK